MLIFLINQNIVACDTLILVLESEAAAVYVRNVSLEKIKWKQGGVSSFCPRTKIHPRGCWRSVYIS